MTRTTPAPAPPWLAVILGVSAVLRVWLAMAGGQYWWPDESRFDASRSAVAAALQGHLQAAGLALFGSADHVGFKILGTLPALAVTAGLPLWTASVFFGAFSVGSIYLVWKLAALTARDDRVALWAAFFAAISVDLFYYSRHLLPYDPALFFGLYAMAVGLRQPGTSAAFQAGIWSAVGFLTYNGYWLFCGVALIIAVIGPAPTPRRIARRLAVGTAGFLIPLGAVVLMSFAVGSDWILGALGFAGTVTYGDYDEGWSFAWKYFWASEGWLTIVWGVALLLGLTTPSRRPFVLRWLWPAILLYVGLGVLSAVAHLFVVYGRIARSLIPFFALIAGAAMAELGARRFHGVRFAVALALLIGAAIRFASPLSQWFPDDFAARGRQLIAQHAPTERIRIVNAYSMYRPVFVDLAGAETLFARRHPLQYRPFLFENLKHAQRVEFEAHDLTMRVIRLSADAPGGARLAPPGLHGYPGPLRLVLRLPRHGTGYNPVVVTGAGARAADYVSLVRVGTNRFRMSFVHWYAPEWLSPELPLDEATDHTVDVSLGSLLPAAAAMEPQAAWAVLRRWVFVAVDGRVICSQPSEFHPATPGGIDIGCNMIGGLVTEPRFAGTIERVTALAPDEVLRQARMAAAPLSAAP